MPSKTEQARQIAAQFFETMEYSALKAKIKEEVNCSRTLAHNAIQWVRDKRKKTTTEPQPPQVEVVHEEPKDVAFIEEPTQKPSEELAIPKEPQPLQELEPLPVLPDLEVFKDMMRGFYIMILSKKGLLGSKYGRDEDQCAQCADQMYRWLYRRYGEELIKHDTILLVLSHGALLGGIGTEWINDRRKEQEKQAKKKEKEQEKSSKTD